MTKIVLGHLFQSLNIFAWHAFSLKNTYSVSGSKAKAVLPGKNEAVNCKEQARVQKVAYTFRELANKSCLTFTMKYASVSHVLIRKILIGKRIELLFHYSPVFRSIATCSRIFQQVSKCQVMRVFVHNVFVTSPFFGNITSVLCKEILPYVYRL